MPIRWIEIDDEVWKICKNMHSPLLTRPTLFSTNYYSIEKDPK